MAIDTKAMNDILKKGFIETFNEAAARASYQNSYQQNVITNSYVSTGGTMPTVIGTLYDGPSDTYIDQMSDGTVRMRKLNKSPEVQLVASPNLTSLSFVSGTGLTTYGGTITTWGVAPAVEKSPEEKMEDALDAAVRAARKAV